MDKEYSDQKKSIETQDNYKCEEYTINIPTFLFKDKKDCDSFVKAFYGSPTYVMKKISWEWIEVKPKTSIKFIKEEKEKYWYIVKQEWTLKDK